MVGCTTPKTPHRCKKFIPAMEYNAMQLVKRRFFALRNGIVADLLRRANPGYRMIFGLTLPQIAEVAADTPHTPQMATELWADTRTRESRLLATMLYPPASMDRAVAMEWMCGAATVEEADILCHKLLRHLPFATSLAAEGLESSSEMTRYASLRLLRNLMPPCVAEAESAARAELLRDNPLTRQLCLAIIDEADFINQR